MSASLEARVRHLQIQIGVLALVALALAILTILLWLRPSGLPDRIELTSGEEVMRLDASGLRISDKNDTVWITPQQISLHDRADSALEKQMHSMRLSSPGGLVINEGTSSLRLELRGGEPVLSGRAPNDVSFELEGSAKHGTMLWLRGGGGSAKLRTRSDVNVGLELSLPGKIPVRLESTK